MDVSVIIVSYNVSALLCKCIDSIIQYTSDVKYEIIVIDNSSSDDTVKKVQASYPQVKLIPSEINLGFGKANNVGASIAKGKYLFFLNPDTELLNNALLVLYKFMEDNQNVALCGANLYTPEKEPNKSYEMFLPSFWDAVAYVGNFSVKHKDEEKFNPSVFPKPVRLVSGADMFMIKSVFETIGRFDEHFFMYFEEPIFSHKIEKLKMLLYSVPTAHIIHHEGASSKKKRLTTFYFLDSFLKYYKLYYETAFPILYVLLKSKSLLAICYYHLKHDSDKLDYWKGFSEVLTSSKNMVI